MIVQMQKEPITRKIKEEIDLQMSREFSSVPQTSELKEQTQRMDMMEAKIDKLLMQSGKIWLHSSKHTVCDTHHYCERKLQLYPIEEGVFENGIKKLPFSLWSGYDKVSN